MNVPARFRNLLLAAGLVAAVGCSSDDPKSPTAPPTTPVPPVTPVTYSVTVSPSKSALEVGTTDSSVITITVARTDNGAPPPNLTKATLTTTLGAFGNNAGLQTLEAELINGQVQVAFFPGGTVGTATIRVQVGGSVGFGSIRVVEDQTDPFFIASVSPNVGGPLGGEDVTIIGGGFDPPIRVLFGGVPAVVKSSTATQIRVETPALVGSLETCGTNPSACNQTVAVSVTINLNEEGVATDSLANAYSYSNGGGGSILQPIIFSVTPSSGLNEGGTQVVINGDGFEAPVQVEFGKGSLTIPFVEAQLVSVTRTRIVVLSPAASAFGQGNLNQLVDIRVRNLNSGRTALAANAFKYGVQVLITSIGPGEGPSTGGTQVTVFGQGFDEPVAVSMGQHAQQVLSVSGTEIVVLTVPIVITNCADVSGATSVTNLETGNGFSNGPIFTYRAPKPIITGVSPSNGSQNGGQAVTISGINFTSPSIVEFVIGGQAYSAGVGAITSSTISATTPAFPNSAVCTGTCDDDADTVMGTRCTATAAGIRVTSPTTGCTNTLSGAFLVNPASVCIND
ncbi:MAG: IPT/TIG domain-containing protein [Thermoanaerobaculia bacterium]|nr:IPT/TIG domain-containing protein [Thermoanaerobaculia bacterium]